MIYSLSNLKTIISGNNLVSVLNWNLEIVVLIFISDNDNIKYAFLTKLEPGNADQRRYLSPLIFIIKG